MLHDVDKNKRDCWAFCPDLDAPIVDISYYFIRKKGENTLILWHYKQNSLTPLSYIDIYILAFQLRGFLKEQKAALWPLDPKGDYHGAIRS